MILVRTEERLPGETSAPPSLLPACPRLAMELGSVILTTGASVGVFRLVNAGVGMLPVPESARRNAWKWRNISTSFVHSVITAVWAVLW